MFVAVIRFFSASLIILAIVWHIPYEDYLDWAREHVHGEERNTVSLAPFYEDYQRRREQRARRNERTSRGVPKDSKNKSGLQEYELGKNRDPHPISRHIKNVPMNGAQGGSTRPRAERGKHTHTFSSDARRVADKNLHALALGMLSETNRPKEQIAVGCVIYNRKRKGYRGADSFIEVVFADRQFSAFNDDWLIWSDERKRKERLLSLDLADTSTVGVWRGTVRRARKLQAAPKETCPRSFREVTHFFSEVSRENRKWPSWAYRYTHVEDPWGIPLSRFRFFAS